MSNEHSLTDNIVYNMVSVQYHALKSANVYGRYLEDCHGHEDVSAFILQCQAEDAARVQRAHDLIRSLMQGGESEAAAPEAAEPEPEAAEPEPDLAGVAAGGAVPEAAAAGSGRRRRMPSGEKVTRWR